MVYEVKFSSRKTAAIQIKPDGTVVVRVPDIYSSQMVESLVESHRDWIEKKLIDQKRVEKEYQIKELTEAERLDAILRARQLIPERVAYYADKMGVTYNKITIKEQKTRWGSCSAKGNLNFNWRLILAPEHVLDYVVVHELAHRSIMNHSKEFYALIHQTLPEFKDACLWLRRYGYTIIS